MCIYCDYCVYHYKFTELVSLYTLDIGLKINIIIIVCVLLYSTLVFLYSSDKRKTVSFSQNLYVTCASESKINKVKINVMYLF